MCLWLWNDFMISVFFFNLYLWKVSFEYLSRTEYKCDKPQLWNVDCEIWWWCLCHLQVSRPLDDLWYWYLDLCTSHLLTLTETHLPEQCLFCRESYFICHTFFLFFKNRNWCVVCINGKYWQMCTNGQLFIPFVSLFVKQTLL